MNKEVFEEMYNNIAEKHSIYIQNMTFEKNNLINLLENFANALKNGFSDADMVNYEKAINRSVENYRTWYYEVYDDCGNEIKND